MNNIPARVIDLIYILLKQGAKISIMDPLAIPEAEKLFGNNVFYPNSINKALTNADLCILGLNYQEFVPISEQLKLMKSPIILDLCDHQIQNKLNNIKLKNFYYKGILW